MNNEGHYCGQAISSSSWHTQQPALFAYGTLMSEAIMRQISGQLIKGEAATLNNFRRLAILGEEYPAVIAAAGYQVDGLLYDGLSEEAWERLDAFEGDEYQRQQVQLTTANGVIRHADVYIFKQEYHHRLSDQEWDFTRFINQGGRERFEARYPGYGKLIE